MGAPTPLIARVTTPVYGRVVIDASDGMRYHTDLSSFSGVFCFPETRAAWEQVGIDPYGLALVWTSRFEVHVDQIIEAAWLGFFERNVPKVRARNAAQAFELVMKYGLGPSYWNEYIAEGYWDHGDQVIRLRGLPDVAESRPHSPKYNPSFEFPGETRRRYGEGRY